MAKNQKSIVFASKKTDLVTVSVQKFITISGGGNPNYDLPMEIVYSVL